MTPDDDLRSRLDRLVAPPDSTQGWETVRVRARHAKRRHDTIMGSLAAVVVAMLIGATVLALGAGGPPEGVIAGSGSTTSTTTSTTTPSTTSSPLATTTTPSLPVPGDNTVPDTTTNGGGSGGTGGANPGSGTTPGGPGTTVPGSATSVPSGGTTVPQGGGTTVPGSGPTTTVPGPSLDEVQNAIQGKYSGRSVWRAISRATVGGQPVVVVRLRADAVQTAVEIQDQWPGTVVYLGFYAYPKPSAAPAPASAPCGSGLLPADVALPAGLVASNDVPATVTSGHDFSGTLTVTNGGKAAVDVTAGSHVLVTLFKPSGAVAGCLDGAAAGEASETTLNPGDTRLIALSGGTASNAKDHWAVPSGTYVAVAHIQVGTTDVTYRFPITIT